MKNLLLKLHEGEHGHAIPVLGAIVSGAGAIILAIGAVNDNSALTIAGGIVAAVGFIAYDLLRHMFIDYEFFRRTTK